MRKTMLKKTLLLLALTLCMLPFLVQKAYADYDYIDYYSIDVEPQGEDGSLVLTAWLEWTPLETLDHGTELKIGVPNGKIYEVTALTENIENIDHDNEYMYIYLDKTIPANETVTFGYTWVQEYMYTIDPETGHVCYEYTPGWFNSIHVGYMEVNWFLVDGAQGEVWFSSDDDDWYVDENYTLYSENLDYGETVTLRADYEQWPTLLTAENSADNLPSDYRNDSYAQDDTMETFIGFVVFMFIIIAIIIAINKSIMKNRSRAAYNGGFGTRYVYVNHLWYPAGRDNKPVPGSVGTKTKPLAPTSGGTSGRSGLGGSSRSGSSSSTRSGFGGSSRGGGGCACACASSCACACACACAGGGRAGCSAKNLYGAVHVSEDVLKRNAQ